ncbi:hypothetical protein FACS1894171_0600 [Clostridia bacterium]|nr:hypothetical protein FACS1894171_0600 [Clostridia bacterium]
MSFERSNKSKYCWRRKGFRPSVPCRHVRGYRYAYGAVDPVEGEEFFLVLPDSNTICINVFLTELSEKYADDRSIMVCDKAARHRSGTLLVPENITLMYGRAGDESD